MGDESLYGFMGGQNGAASCTSELAVYKDGEIHSWDRGYNEEGAQVYVFVLMCMACVVGWVIDRSI